MNPETNEYGYSVKVIADSQPKGVMSDAPRLITFQLRYPRFVHAELMTHRVFSRNASSSRAIPVEKMLENIKKGPAMPVEWGSNQSGMQAGDQVDEETQKRAQKVWNKAKADAVKHARQLASLGLHKQIVNRLTEPYQFIDVLVTATEWDNWFRLRDHSDAQPEIRELARLMRIASEASTPAESRDHLPYLDSEEIRQLTWMNARMISAARCARVSYRNHDQSHPDQSKDYDLARRLISSGHMSPTEHQADLVYSGGITHASFPDGKILWSNNFREWNQFRAYIDKGSIDIG